jgi:siroheme synthase-like protein
MIEPNVYVACLNLKGRRALVVGAGKIGLEKIEGLLNCDARVTVVAPDAVEGFERVVADHEQIEWHRRAYRTEDLDDHFLVVAATSDNDLNRRVYADAETRAMLVNVVDVPELCNFILPAIVRRPPLTFAVSTAGASPALAKRIRNEIAESFGDEYARLAELLDEVREWAKSTLSTYDERREFFESIVNADPDPIELLRAGDADGVRALIERAKQAV